MQALKAWIQRYQLASLVLLTVLLAVVLPLALDIFRLNLVGKYLTYAFVAIGLVMVWGYGGVLSLGQGVFFGLRSEEHTSELQSQSNLLCRLLLVKKNKHT